MYSEKSIINSILSTVLLRLMLGFLSYKIVENNASAKVNLKTMHSNKTIIFM